jgi:hypothetical protein
MNASDWLRKRLRNRTGCVSWMAVSVAALLLVRVLA